MDQRFKECVDSLEPNFLRLVNSTPAERTAISEKGGVYLFTEGTKHLYVGRTKNLKRRIYEHSTPSSDDVPFAFRLAREKTNRSRATYKTHGSRKELLKDPKFKVAFAEAKKRIRGMSVRFVVEEDPLKQALLEIYVALALSTPHNDFDTH
jgi:predicted GIY-YIG superfamily endonuclease